MPFAGAASVAKGRRWPIKPYRRLSFSEKADYASQPRREVYRCNRCRTVVEDRERGAHLQRCFPVALEKRFTKVD
jgi:hypothetical protein